MVAPVGVSPLRSSSGRRRTAPAVRACVHVPMRARVRVCLGLCLGFFLGLRVLICSCERMRLCLRAHARVLVGVSVDARGHGVRATATLIRAMRQVLTYIEKRQLLPPLMVIQTLSQSSTATLSVVKVRLPLRCPRGTAVPFLPEGRHGTQPPRVRRRCGLPMPSMCT